MTTFDAPATADPAVPGPPAADAEGAATGRAPAVDASATPGSGSESRVWQLTFLMLGLALVVAVPMVLAEPKAAVPDLTWWTLLPLFGLAEVLVIHLPAQRSSHSHTLREIPAIAGLTFLAPQQYVSAYVLGAGLALLLWARLRGLKLAFNVSMYALEAVLGLTVYQLVLQGGDPIAPRAWAAAVAAVLLTDLLSAAAVTAAISFTEGSFDGAVMREALRSGVPAAMVNTCVALLVVTLVSDRPSALPLLGVICVLLVLGYRVYVSLARGHARAELLYRFLSSTGGLTDPDEIMAAVLAESAQLLHAARAQLITVEVSRPGGSRGHTARRTTWEAGVVTVDEPSVSPADWWRPALEGTPVLHGHHAKPAGHGADPNAPRDGIAVRLAAKEAVEQVLIVSDRTFEEETFGAEDLQVFQTLAMHAAMAMDRAGMTERLTRLAADRAHEAMHDPLTGLPNRRAFNDAVDAAMTSADRGTASGVVLLLDIDDFKDVNDTLGHSAGDRLLVVTGERLQAIGGGVVARLGGDEFAVLLPGEDAAAGLAHARELHAVLSRPVPLADVLLTTSASIGVAEYQGASCSSDDLLARADVAMYAAKAERSGVAAYRPEDGNSTARRLALAADLPRALDSGALTLWYQPQARGTTGEVTGFEALLRWEHPEYGLVPPPEVVAVAQRTGLVRALTDHLVRQALDARKEWSDHGLDLDVSVNVTPRDVADLDFVDRVTEALTATSTRPEALVLEITESDAMRDPERALQVLEALAAVGVRLSVDDFGTGYSSLAYLDRLPVHEVKIDQSFVFRIEQQPADSTIVRATVSLAHELGLRVVAEGVENDLAKTLMAELGCDLYQGFGLARPMPAGDVVTWVSRHRSHARGPVRDLDRSVGRLTGSPAAPW